MGDKANITQLIEQCKQQEWEAQEGLYLLFADEMMQVAMRYANGYNSAKDLVQDTFLSAFQNIHQYKEAKGAFGAWLRRILINKSYADLRKSQRIEYHSIIQGEHEDIAEATIIQELEAEDVLKLLHGLPKGCRIIFNMKVIEGYTHDEIAKLLSITASASRSQLTRAKQLLRQALKKRSQSDNRRMFQRKSSIV